jgi:hypothetical protein
MDMIDELIPIAVYMAHEMNANSRSPDRRKMAQLNAVSSTACVAEYFRAPWWQRLFGAMSRRQCIDLEVSRADKA